MFSAGKCIKLCSIMFSVLKFSFGQSPATEGGKKANWTFDSSGQL